MRYKSHRVYPPEIIQTSSLGRLQKKSLEPNDCLYQRLYWKGVLENPQKTMQLVLKITFKPFKQIAEVLFSCF